MANWDSNRESKSGSDAVLSFMAEWKTSKLQSSETTSVALSSQAASEDFLNYQECRSASLTQITLLQGMDSLSVCTFERTRVSYMCPQKYLAHWQGSCVWLSESGIVAKAITSTNRFLSNIGEASLLSESHNYRRTLAKTKFGNYLGSLMGLGSIPCVIKCLMPQMLLWR